MVNFVDCQSYAYSGLTLENSYAATQNLIK